MVRAGESRITKEIKEGIQRKVLQQLRPGSSTTSNVSTPRELAEATNNVMLTEQTLTPSAVHPNGFVPCRPCLIGNRGLSHDTPLRRQAMAYGARFCGTTERNTYGRGQKALSPESSAACVDLLKSCFGSQLIELDISKVSPGPVTQALTASVVVIEKKKSFNAIEHANLPTMRTTFAGRRSVVMAHLSDVLQFIGQTVQAPAKKKGKPGNDQAKNNKLKEATNFFQNATLRDFSDFKTKGFDLYFADVLPGQCLYMPPGFVFHETIGAEDYVGSKCVVFLCAPQQTSTQSVANDKKKDGTGTSLMSVLDLLDETCRVFMMHSLPACVVTQSIVDILTEQT